MIGGLWGLSAAVVMEKAIIQVPAAGRSPGPDPRQPTKVYNKGMDLGQTLFALIAAPDVAYVLLMLGLILLAIAVTTPGTGLAEVAAGICLVLAIVGMLQLPVNLAGLLLLLIGIGLFFVDLKVQSGLIALAATVTLAFGSLFLFKLSETATGVSLWLIGLTTAATAAFFVFGLSGVVKVMRQKPLTAPENIVGARGTMITAASEAGHLMGTAQVKSELWTIRASEPIPAGAAVQVEGIDGLVLTVHKV